LTNKTTKEIRLIGGVGKYGSGEVIDQVKILLDRNYVLEFHNTQGLRILGLIKLIISLVKNKKLTIFQPSISFPAFLRDIIIFLSLKFSLSPRIFLLLTRLDFRNKIMKHKFFQKLFFSNHRIISTAKHLLLEGEIPIFRQFIPSLHELQNNHKLNRDFKNKVICHFGYLEEFKGFKKFVSVSKKYSHFNFLAIGQHLKKRKNYHVNSHGNLEILETKDINSFKREMIKSLKNNPIFLFCSNQDLSPLVVLECGALGIPIICLKGSVSEEILNNFIPRDCFTSLKNLNEISSSNFVVDLKRSLFQMDLYLSKLTLKNFSEDFLKAIT
tara:strand:- start:54 stop:1034 length:981 start_codon:yes stop_codon:yes gene_type:complete